MGPDIRHLIARCKSIQRWQHRNWNQTARDDIKAQWQLINDVATANQIAAIGQEAWDEAAELVDQVSGINR